MTSNRRHQIIPVHREGRILGPRFASRRVRNLPESDAHIIVVRDFRHGERREKTEHRMRFITADNRGTFYTGKNMKEICVWEMFAHFDSGLTRDLFMDAFDSNRF